MTPKEKIEKFLSDNKLDGKELSEGIYLIGEPSYRPDLGPLSMACLANYFGNLVLLQLTLKEE